MPRITISFYHFDLSSPYTEGHILTEAEAFALNNLRATNIRDAIGVIVRRHERKSGGLMTGVQLHQLNEFAANADLKYQFPNPSQNQPIPKSGTIAAEIRALAIEKLDGVMRALGRGMDPIEYEQRLKAECESAELYNLAHRRISARIEATKKSIEDLL